MMDKLLYWVALSGISVVSLFMGYLAWRYKTFVSNWHYARMKPFGRFCTRLSQAVMTAITIAFILAKIVSIYYPGIFPSLNTKREKYSPPVEPAGYTGEAAFGNDGEAPELDVEASLSTPIEEEALPLVDVDQETESEAKPEDEEDNLPSLEPENEEPDSTKVDRSEVEA